MAVIPLEKEQVSAFYDTEAKLLRVTYRGVLSPQISTEFYAWLGTAMQTNPTLILEAKGSIFDFCQVTDFVNSNLSTVRKQSQNLSQSSDDVKNHPVALVVKTALQERMVSVTMKLTPQNDRKKVVYSIEDAQKYIIEWHKKHETMSE